MYAKELLKLPTDAARSLHDGCILALGILYAISDMELTGPGERIDAGENGEMRIGE